MLRSLLPLLICPDCHGSLTIADEPTADEQRVQNGVLSCTGCAASFSIECGIPRLMPKSILEAQKDEIQARDAQVSQYDSNGFLSLFGKVEIPMTVSRLDLQRGDLLLEAGCGTGRMTLTFSASVREQVSADFSFASLRAAQAKAEAAGATNIHFIQADLCNLPLADAIFDRVVSCQVLEHVPGAEARAKAVASLGRVAKPGARTVISGYRYSRLMGAKEGRHDGGIPFYRFSRQEFVELIGTKFKVESVTGSLGYLYLARGSKSG